MLFIAHKISKNPCEKHKMGVYYDKRAEKVIFRV